MVILLCWGGEIIDNGSGNGRGVYNTGNKYDTVGVYSGHGTFEWLGGVIRNNTSDEYDDVYYVVNESQDESLFGGDVFYLLFIGVTVVMFVVILLFYHSKKSKCGVPI